MSPTLLDDDVLRDIDAYWRAANYLTVGQIYLQENALLREPLRAEHIKPRLMGHWGTSPGLSFLYAHLNRVIQARGNEVLYLTGPGHGGPAIVANVYLEGTYSEVYPTISEDAAGMRRLFRQFSTPGGIPSHAGPPTPGSIHEGGELGYVLSHAFGAVMDNPKLVAVAVVGDGEAETAPLEGAWKGLRFLNPARDGAVLPVLHLNGYKIAGPTVLARASDATLTKLFEGHGYQVHFVEGKEPAAMHREMAKVLDECFDALAERQAKAKAGKPVDGLSPLIVLRSPKGWTGPKEWHGKKIEDSFRSHQVPLTAVRTDPEQLAALEAWLRSYRPEELFDAEGRLIPALRKLAPKGERRLGKTPHGNGGLLTKELVQPAMEAYALDVPSPGTVRAESTRALGAMLRDLYRENPHNFRLFCPDETNSNRLGAVFEASDRCFQEATLPEDDHVSASGRVMEVLSEHNLQGWLEGYLLTGRHGLFATYEAFALIVASMATQHAKWLDVCRTLPWRASVPSLNYLLTSTCWRNDHNGFSHQGPGFMDTLLSKKGNVVRVYLPPDANCLLSVADHVFASKDYVNVVIIDKQPQLQWLTLDEAKAHCAKGASTWSWAGNEQATGPDVVLGCAGDTATLEIVAAAAWLREHAPELSVRVVNVVDLMTLFSPREHPHGMSPEAFEQLFPPGVPVIFSFHGYAGAIHQLLHGREDPKRFHVRGYKEEGTTTTPFDMVVLNETSRFHLVIDALRRSTKQLPNHDELVASCEATLARHRTYVHEHFDDLPEIRDWTVGSSTSVTTPAVTTKR
jgi:xylulose-5-phosphate/fructose-6-phosphate phosphoketolase